MTELEVERLVVRLVGDGSSYQRMMKEAQSAAVKTGKAVADQSKHIDGLKASLGGFARGIASQAAAGVGVVGTLGTAFKALTLAADAEKMEVAFEVMLQSGNKARKLMADLTELGAKTPLNLPDIQAAAKQLLNANVPAEKIVSTLRAIGDVAGGDREKVQRLALAYSQAMTKGRLQGDEVLQMTEAGYNPTADLAAILGKTNAEVLKLQEQGKITGDLLEKAFLRASGPSGKFFNQMEKQSKTLSGLFSTLQDDVGGFLRTVGQELVSVFRLKDVIQAVSGFAQETTKWFKELSPETKRVLFVLVAVAGMVGTLITLWPVIAAVAGTAFAAVKAAVLAVFSPINLLVGAAVALVAAYVQATGGWEAAWGRIQQAAANAWDEIKALYQDFLDWSKPVWEQAKYTAQAAWESLQRTAVTVWEGIKAAWSEVKSFFSDLWTVVTGGGQNTWYDIQDAAVMALKMIEFGINNIELVWELATTQMALSLVKLFNEFVFFHTDTAPYLIGYVWKLAQQMNSNLVTLWANLIQNMVALFANLPGLIAGTVQWDDVWKPLTEGMKLEIDKVVLPQRGKSDLEKTLEDDVDRVAGNIAKKWAEFEKMDKERKRHMAGDEMDEFDWSTVFVEKKDPEVKKQEQKAADLKKALEMQDSVRRNSLKSFLALEDYRNMLDGGRGPERDERSRLAAEAEMSKMYRMNAEIDNVFARKDGAKPNDEAGIKALFTKAGVKGTEEKESLNKQDTMIDLLRTIASGTNVRLSAANLQG